jgi:hypothetical protein
VLQLLATGVLGASIITTCEHNTADQQTQGSMCLRLAPGLSVSNFETQSMQHAHSMHDFNISIRCHASSTIRPKHVVSSHMAPSSSSSAAAAVTWHHPACYPALPDCITATAQQTAVLYSERLNCVEVCLPQKSNSVQQHSPSAAGANMLLLRGTQ